MWPFSMPHFKVEVEDGKGNRWEKNGGPALLEVQRDGPVQLPAAAAIGVRYFQELRGTFTCCLHGWQRRCDAWQSHLLRAEGGSSCRWQEKMSPQHPSRIVHRP